MSKPGGKPIVKKRPFFEDGNFSICTLHKDSRLLGFETIVKSTNVTKIFKVNNKYEIKKAWQELENYLNPIAQKLLSKTMVK